MPVLRAKLSGLFRRAARWLLPAALLAVTPKCVLCVLAYASLGTALGLGGGELCGAAGNSSAVWTTPLAWLGLTVALGSAVAARWSQRSRVARLRQ